MVVRKLLASTQPNRHETSTALCNTYRRVSLRRQHVLIRFSQECATKNQKRTVHHFVFTKKVYGLLCMVRPFCYCGSAVLEMPSWDVVYGP